MIQLPKCVELIKINSVLMRFQEQLSQVPKWNQDIINEEYERIIKTQDVIG